MAIDANLDPMAFLEEAMKPQPRAGGEFKSYPWTGPKEFQKALIHPLLNIMDTSAPYGQGAIQLVDVYKHDLYTGGKYVYSNLCTKNLDMPCAICAEVEAMPETTPEEKKAKRDAASSRRFILPVYLHALMTDVVGQPATLVTYKDKDGVEHPVCGPRLLEMKPDSNEIFAALMAAWNNPEGSHDIRNLDFKITRFRGSNGFLGRKAEPQAPSSQFVVPADLPAEYLSKAGVNDLYWELCPPRIVGQDSTPAQSSSPASNGAVKTAPDF